MRPYLDLLQTLLDRGNEKGDRTGTGTYSIFGHQLRFDLQEGFPLVTTKAIHVKSIIHELLWFLRGDTNLAYLHEHGVTIWDEWADRRGDLGPIYGSQWRAWIAGETAVETAIGVFPETIYIDQIKTLVDGIKDTPNSRRLLVSAWNPADLPDERVSPQANVEAGKMALATCHPFFQCYVYDGRLSLQFYMRSSDTFLGLPFNIASYALLTHMLAQQCDLGVGDLIWTGGDVHLYRNHVEQAKLQLTREPRPLPRLELRRASAIDTYTFEDFNLVGYDPHPAIRAPVAV